tara:strand:- start:782 stop:985 length:204 start_codon:yes stop_codon:yes gene_type:complete
MEKLFVEEIERYFHCPYCGEVISMLLYILPGLQQYIEDCEVCCRPIELRVSVKGDFIDGFSVCRIDC